MKFVVKFDNVAYFRAKLDEYCKVADMEINEEWTDHGKAYYKKVIQTTKIFRNNVNAVLEMMADENHPLSGLSQRTIDMIMKALLYHRSYDNSFYRMKPLRLLWALLSIIVVSDGIKVMKHDFNRSLFRINLSAGNYDQVVAKGHGKEVFTNLVENGVSSIYWKRVDNFITISD